MSTFFSMVGSKGVPVSSITTQIRFNYFWWFGGKNVILQAKHLKCKYSNYNHMETRIEDLDGKLVATLEGEMDTAAAVEAEEVLKPLYNSEGKDVIIIEDIIDSGNTLSKLIPLLEERKPASLEVCTLLDKPERREVEVNVKYNGFNIPDEFVVGYGLDYDQKYRNLPFIGVLHMDEN